MNTFVIFSRHDQSRDWQHEPEGTPRVDWYDRQARQQLLEQTGPLHVGLFPTVGIHVEPYVDYTDGEQQIKAGWVLVHAPDTWADVEAVQADYVDRTERGWADFVNKPETGDLSWTQPPETSDDEIAVPSWVGNETEGWVLTWDVKPIEGDDNDETGNQDDND